MKWEKVVYLNAADAQHYSLSTFWGEGRGEGHKR